MPSTIQIRENKLLIISHAFGELQSMLQNPKYAFCNVSNVKDAWAYIQEQIPDVILIDGKIMRLDSYKLLEQIRKSTQFSKTPILGILERDVSIRQVEEALDNGMTRFVTHPVPPELLRKRIDSLLEESNTNEFTDNIDSIDAVQLLNSLPIPATISSIKIQEGNDISSVRIEQLNSAFKETIGYSLDEISTISDWWQKAYPNEEYRNEITKKWFVSLEHQQNSIYSEFPPIEAKIRCKDEKNRWFEVFTFPVGDKHLTCLIDTSIIQDVNSKLKQSLESEKAIRQAMSDIQGQMVQNERLAIFGQLASSISHQVANPVNFLSAGLENLDELSAEYSGFVSSLLGDDSDDRREEFQDLDESIQDMIAVMKEGSDKIMNVVKYLRDFSQTEQGNKLEPIDLEEVIKGAITLTSHLTDGRVKVEIDFSPTTSVKGFAQQLSQVFLSLMNNAIEAVEGKGGGIINIKTWKEENYNVVEIRDNGKGISENAKDKIFQSFFTTKKAKTNSSSGLGLTIARQIVMEYGGGIAFESEVEKGSTFTVRLPTYDK
ncbi:MAG: signal transduction histidine kinase/CheY-like chemotaxis protein [Arenicella sp.]|jgi:signal transduction histidine kinase/CheY-like chemotaxis protein